MLQGTGSEVDLIYDGYEISLWNGTNNQNQLVSNGTYRVEIDSVGNTGIVTSVYQMATVNRNLSNSVAQIYNSAGELVRTLSQTVAQATGSTMSDMSLSSNSIMPGAPASITSEPSVVQIQIQTTSSPVTMSWDATNDQGAYVSPGTYTISVHWSNGTSLAQNISRLVTVLAGNGPGGSVVARPNSLNANNGMTTTFDASRVQNAASVKVQLYTVTGEFIKSVSSNSGGDLIAASWDATGMASGIYIAVATVENANGGVVKTQRLKILVVH
jgi:flagellar hook assembly protein FlgD